MESNHDLDCFTFRQNPDGSMHVSGIGSCALALQSKYIALIGLESSANEGHRMLQDALKKIEVRDGIIERQRKDMKSAVKDAEESFLSSHRGGWDKIGCGDKADAEILAKAIKGSSVSELLKGRYTYDREGHKRVYGRSKIFSATSVKKPEDFKRIMDLYDKYPEVFGCSQIELVRWYLSKHKGGKSI